VAQAAAARPATARLIRVAAANPPAAVGPKWLAGGAACPLASPPVATPCSARARTRTCCDPSSPSCTPPPSSAHGCACRRRLLAQSRCERRDKEWWSVNVMGSRVLHGASRHENLVFEQVHPGVLVAQGYQPVDRRILLSTSRPPVPTTATTTSGSKRGTAPRRGPGSSNASTRQWLGSALVSVADARDNMVACLKACGVADPHATTSGQIDPWAGQVMTEDAVKTPSSPSSPTCQRLELLLLCCLLRSEVRLAALVGEAGRAARPFAHAGLVASRSGLAARSASLSCLAASTYHPF
jgi:hypothetical protein